MSVSLQLRLDENMNNFVELDKRLITFFSINFIVMKGKKTDAKTVFFPRNKKL